MHARLLRFLPAVALALALPASAWAHASLVRTIPANGAAVAKAPAAVRVVFDDAVRVGPGIAAIRNGGGSVLGGKARIAAERTLVIPLRSGLPDGAYSVRWSIVSDDGHLESGVLAFAVGAGGHATAALTAEGTGPRAADVIARWLLYAGLLTAVGIALFALVARPRETERLALLLSTACVLVAVGAGEEASRIGLDTRAGIALTAELAAAVVVAMLAGAATLERRVLQVAAVLAPGLVLAPAFAGHALDSGVGRFNVPVDALHVLGAGAWVGALVALVALRSASRRHAVILALGGVVLLAATGVVRAWSELLGVSQLWETSYGQTLLVKTGALLVALAAGFLLRARIRERATAELAVVAGIVVAVSVLVLLPPGRSVEAAPPVRVSTSEPSPQPAAPPKDAVLLAREVGELGVALALEPKRATAIVLSPAGGGLSGLDVRLNGVEADGCGSGCYRVDRAPGARVEVQIDRFGPTLRSVFDVPPDPRPGGAVLRGVEDRFSSLRSVFYLERLASSPSHAVTALWRLEAPNRVAYQIPGGAEGIVIGARRWDRSSPDGTWQSSAQTPLEQPATQWAESANVHVTATDASTKTLTFVDPTTPAYFEVVVDSKTMLPRTVRMTAAAHFMVDRYVRFNAPRAIYPPR
ncbi:MAG TPA: copper resistance protein CopC [Gaiellaceae bacterium]|nr:copper resistance protein CopC [Gaiellaceae bacterium]